MEKKTLSLPVNKEALNQVKQVDPNAQLVIKATARTNYKLFDNVTNESFDYVKVKRKGGDLEIRILEQTRAIDELPPDVVIKDFYSLEDVSLLGQDTLAEGALTVAEYVPTLAPAGTQVASLSMLPDGMAMVAKAGLSSVAGAAGAVTAASGTAALAGASTMTYVAAGGGVAVAAAAGGGAAGGGTATPSTTPSTVTAAEQALSSISSAAANNTANASTPSVVTYATAGVTGVTEANLAAVNSALNTDAVNGAATNTVAKIQTIVDAYVAILVEANGPVVDATPNGDPSAAQYALIGASLGAAASDAEGLGLLNDVLGTKTTSDVDSVGKINNLAAAVNAVMAAAAGGAAPTKDDLALLGITGVTDSNLAAVQRAIQDTADDGSGVDTLSELQAVVTAAGTNSQAVSDISSAAANNTANASTPSVVTYATAGVTGVTAANLAAVNSALNTDAVDGAATNTVAKIQAIVDAYQVVLNNAAAATSDDAASIANASQDDYQKIGVSGVDSAVKAALLSDAIDHKATADVDTIAEIQELANTVAKIMGRAAGGNDAITEAEFATLGIQNLNASRTSALLEAIKNTIDNGSGVDTLDEIQALVDTQAPTVTGQTIGDIAPTANLTLTFNEAVFKGSGDIKLYQSNGTLVETFTVPSSTKVSIIGKTVTIDPTDLLKSGVSYYVTVDSGVFTDTAGNAFNGIADSSGWTFKGLGAFDHGELERNW